MRLGRHLNASPKCHKWSSVGVRVHFEASPAKATVLGGKRKTTHFPKLTVSFQHHHKSSFPSGVVPGRVLPRCRNYEDTLPSCPYSRRWVTFHSFACEESRGQRLGLWPHPSRNSHNPLHIYWSLKIMFMYPDTNCILNPVVVISPPNLGGRSQGHLQQ